MNENEKAQAHAEALENTARSTADRSRIWSGLAKYLSAAARREHESAEKDRTDQGR